MEKWFGNTKEILFILSSASIFCVLCLVQNAYLANAVPRMNDSNLQVQTVMAGLLKPTSMAFLGPDDILVLEQEEGRVYRIIEGVLQVEPVVKVNVSAVDFGKGLLGIDVQKLSNSSYYLFVYFTEAESSDNKTAVGNKLYRYTLVDNATSGPPQGSIVEEKLLLDLPVDAGMTHNGGKVRIDSSGDVNVIIGELHHRRGKAQNFANGTDLDGSGGILTVNQDGGIARDGIFGATHPADKYAAYGIRNSFGLDYDPLTGFLWETENGDYNNDELNLAELGFNSGWNQITGMAPADFNFSSLVEFGGKGRYSDPEFVWNQTVAPTAVEFLRSEKLGKEYQNDLLVGDVNWAQIYRFDLDPERRSLLLEGNLSDHIANSSAENEGIIFGKGFRGITDLKTSPDGYLYVLSQPDGAIYKIVPKSEIPTG